MKGINTPNSTKSKVRMTTLLQNDEPNPVGILRADGRSPFFLTCDHGSNRAPRQLKRLGLAPQDWNRHIAWDIGALGVAENLSSLLDATLISQNYSRLVIDCNRPFQNPESIPIISEETTIPANFHLEDSDRSARQDDIFEPYHGAISRFLNKRHRENKTTIFTAIHSFTPVYKGETRPWDIGILYDQDTRISKPLINLLKRDTSLTVGDNQPYQVGNDHDFSTPVHGEGRSLPYVVLEIRQDHIETQHGQREWGLTLGNILRKLESLLDL